MKLSGYLQIALILVLPVMGLYYLFYEKPLLESERNDLREKVSHLEAKIALETQIKQLIVNELDLPESTNDRVNNHLRDVRKAVDRLSSLFGSNESVASRYFWEYQNCFNKRPAFSAGTGDCLSSLQENLFQHN